MDNIIDQIDKLADDIDSPVKANEKSEPKEE